MACSSQLDVLFAEMNDYCDAQFKSNRSLKYFDINLTQTEVDKFIQYERKLHKLWNVKEQNGKLHFYLIKGSKHSKFSNFSFREYGRGEMAYYIILTCNYNEIRNVLSDNNYIDDNIVMVDEIIDYLPKICFITLYFEESHDHSYDPVDGCCDNNEYVSVQLTVNINYDITEYDDKTHDIKKKLFEIKYSNYIGQKHQPLIIGNENEFKFVKLRYFGQWSLKQHTLFNNKLNEIMEGFNDRVSTGYCTNKKQQNDDVEDDEVAVLKQELNEKLSVIESKCIVQDTTNIFNSINNLCDNHIDDNKISDVLWKNIFDIKNENDVKGLRGMFDERIIRKEKELTNDVENVLKEFENTFGSIFDECDKIEIEGQRNKMNVILKKLKLKSQLFNQIIDENKDEFNNLFNKTRDEIDKLLPNINENILKHVMDIKLNINNMKQIKLSINSFKEEYKNSVNVLALSVKYGTDIDNLCVAVNTKYTKFAQNIDENVFKYNELLKSIEEKYENIKNNLEFDERQKAINLMKETCIKYIKCKETLENELNSYLYVRIDKDILALKYQTKDYIKNRSNEFKQIKNDNYSI